MASSSGLQAFAGCSSELVTRTYVNSACVPPEGYRGKAAHQTHLVLGLFCKSNFGNHTETEQRCPELDDTSRASLAGRAYSPHSRSGCEEALLDSEPPSN